MGEQSSDCFLGTLDGRSMQFVVRPLSLAHIADTLSFSAKAGAVRLRRYFTSEHQNRQVLLPPSLCVPSGRSQMNCSRRCIMATHPGRSLSLCIERSYVHQQKPVYYTWASEKAGPTYPRHGSRAPCSGFCSRWMSSCSAICPRWSV